MLGVLADVGNGTKAGEGCLERAMNMMTRLVNGPMSSAFSYSTVGSPTPERNKIISISLLTPCHPSIRPWVLSGKGQLRTAGKAGKGSDISAAGTRLYFMRMGWVGGWECIDT